MTPGFYPAIFSTGGFTPGFGGKRVLAALSDFRHTASTRAVKELLWARGCYPVPIRPTQGLTGANVGEIVWDSMTEGKWILLCQRHIKIQLAQRL